MRRRKRHDLVIHKELLPINEFTRPGRKLIEVRGVVIHWTGNPEMDARAHVRYFKELSEQKPDDDVADRYASAHYFIGTRGNVHQLIPDDEVAYHAGGKTYIQEALDHLLLIIKKVVLKVSILSCWKIKLLLIHLIELMKQRNHFLILLIIE